MILIVVRPFVGKVAGAQQAQCVVAGRELQVQWTEGSNELSRQSSLASQPIEQFRERGRSEVLAPGERPTVDIYDLRLAGHDTTDSLTERWPINNDQMADDLQGTPFAIGRPALESGWIQRCKQCSQHIGQALQTRSQFFQINHALSMADIPVVA